MSLKQEFKDFIMRGNVIDLAVGMVIGTAFSGIVKSLVDDVIMPPIGLLLGGVDFSNLFITLKDGVPAPEAGYASLAAAKAAGAVTLNVGVFINTIISFLIIAAAIFAVIKAISKLKRETPVEEATAEPREEVGRLREIREELKKEAVALKAERREERHQTASMLYHLLTSLFLLDNYISPRKRYFIKLKTFLQSNRIQVIVL